MSDDATVVERSASIARVGQILVILIAAKVIVASLALYWMVRELVVLVRLRGTGDIGDPQIRAVIAAGRFVWVVNTPLLYATIFTWLIWQFFVHDLVARTAGSRLRFGRWASVGWWFAPFANLVMPYRVMRELWDGSASRPAGSDDERLLRWWVPWDAQVALLYVMLFVGVSGPTIERSIVLHVMAIAGEILFLLCTLPAITVVRALTQSVTAAVPAPAGAGTDLVPIRADRDGETVL